MAISTFCLGCRSLLRLPDDLAGKQVRCQKCNQLFMVPGVLASGPPRPATPSAKPPPRPEPMPVAPPGVSPPSMPPPRAVTPPPTPRKQSAPLDDGVPAVVLVEVPTRPTPPPLEESKPTHAGRTEPAAPSRRAIPPMNLSGRERPRRTNRPRRPTSVLAGLTVTIMALLFVGLLIASGSTWIWAMSRPAIHNGQFVQQPQQAFPPNGGGGQVIGKGPIFPPNGGMQPQPLQNIFPKEGGLEGAVGEGAIFNPGPSSPVPGNNPVTKIALVKGISVVKSQLNGNDTLDSVRRPPFPQLPCKVFLVELKADKRYFIDYSRGPVPGNAFNMPEEHITDPYLRIESQNGTRLVENDDLLLQDMNSRIEFIPTKTATYRVVCTLFKFPLRQGTMPFTLTIREDAKVLPQPRETNNALPRQKATDREVDAVALPAAAPIVGDVCWSEDGKAYFVLDAKGTLTRVALDAFVEQRRLELGKEPGNASMAMSGQGLVLAIPSMNEVWLIDPADLHVKRRFGAFPPHAVASSPRLNFAYVATASDSRRGLYVLDLAKDDAPILFVNVANQAPAITPDGACLFTMNNGFLTRFEIKADGQLVQKQMSGWLGIQPNDARRIDVSSDSKYVCVPGATSPVALPNHPKVGKFPAYAYPVADLQKPAFGINTETPLGAVGFDPKGNRVFAHTGGTPLIVFDAAGNRKAEYSLPGEKQEPLQFLMHPDGNQVLIRFQNKLCFATFRANNVPIVKADPPLPTPTPIKDGETFALAPFKRGDVIYREVQLPNFGKIEPCWDADGQALFHLEADGTLTRIRANDFVPLTSLSLGKPVSAMALSAKGLLVALRDQPEVWVIDPRDLKVQRRIICTSPATHLASHPNLSVAAAVGAEAMLLDLLNGRGAVRGLPVKPVADQPFQNPALTADGTYLFLSQAGPGSSKVLRIRIDKDPPVLEESRDTAVKAAHAFCVHSDQVAWYSSLKNKKQETEFYKAGDWNAPAFTLPERVRAMAAASDGSVYVQTHDNIKTIKVFAQPAKRDVAPATLQWQEGRIREFVPHPQQPRRFLASTDKTVFHGEVVVP